MNRLGFVRLGQWSMTGRWRMTVKLRATVFALATVMAGVPCLGWACTETFDSEQCHVSMFKIYPNTESIDVQWRLRKNKACALQFACHGHEAINLMISRKPMHGSAGVAGFADRGFAYIPNRNFTGQDEFQVTLDNVYQGQSIKTRVNVKVEVTE